MNEDVFTKPPPYGRITDWLGPEMLQRLLDFAQKQRDSFFQTTVGYTEENRRVDLNVRRSSRMIALGSLKEELQTNLRAILPAMFQRLGAEPFEPSKFEVEMVAHGDGALFTEHRDTAIESEDSIEGKKFVAQRVISAVYYFHRLPKSFTGGILRIYPLIGRDKSNAFVEIEPANDRLVFFPSWFPHEVLPVVCPSGRFEDSRFAVNFWIYR
jgi:SM-20-related protein